MPVFRAGNEHCAFVDSRTHRMPINTGSRKPVQLEAVQDWIKTGRVGGLDHFPGPPVSATSLRQDAFR